MHFLFADFEKEKKSIFLYKIKLKINKISSIFIFQIEIRIRNSICFFFQAHGRATR